MAVKYVILNSRVSNFDLFSTLIAIELLGLFPVPLLL